MSRPQSPPLPSGQIMDLYANTIAYLMPDLWDMIRQFPDPRKPQCCLYSAPNLIVTALMGYLSSLPSFRQIDRALGGDPNVMDNIGILCGSPAPAVARGETINYYLAGLAERWLADVLEHAVFNLLKAKRLEVCRERLANTILVAADGTGLTSTTRPIAHSTTRHHGDGTLTYHAYVLLLSFVSPHGIILPFMREFVENGDDYEPEFQKQDCELKAQTKAFALLKKNHPMLRLTVLLDALSLNYDMMDTFRRYGWHFCISHAEDKVPGLRDQLAKKLADGEFRTTVREIASENGKTIQTYRAVDIKYAFGKGREPGAIAVPVTYVDMKRVILDDNNQEVESKKYSRVTSHVIKTPNQMVTFFEDIGCTRWVEENQGFNEMKNLGLNIEHAYGTKGEALKNHFTLQMIAFNIMQLAGKTNLIELVARDVNGGGNVSRSLRIIFKSLAATARAFLNNLKNQALRLLEDYSSWRIRWLTG